MRTSPQVPPPTPALSQVFDWPRGDRAERRARRRGPRAAQSSRARRARFGERASSRPLSASWRRQTGPFAIRPRSAMSEAATESGPVRFNRSAPVGPPRGNHKTVNALAQELSDVAPLERLDDRKRETVETVIRENANGHRAHPMQALRQIVRPIPGGFRRGRYSLAGLLAQASNVVQGFGDRADADIGRARDVADGGVRARIAVLASILTAGGSGRLFSRAVRIQCSFHRAACEPRRRNIVARADKRARRE
jgi:hypothetical protein